MGHRCGWPPCTERYWSKLLHRLGQRGRTPRLPHQRDRLLAPPQQGESASHPGSNSASGVEAPAENFLIWVGGADGLTGWGGVVVAGLRRRGGGGAGWLRLCCVSCSSSTWLSSSWTRLSWPLLCKTGVSVQTVQPVVSRSCSSRTWWRHARCCDDRCMRCSSRTRWRCSLCTTTGALGLKEPKTVEVPQLQCLSMSACAVHRWLWTSL